MEGSQRTGKCRGVDSSAGERKVPELSALHIRGIIHVEGKKKNKNNL